MPAGQDASQDAQAQETAPSTEADAPQPGAADLLPSGIPAEVPGGVPVSVWSAAEAPILLDAPRPTFPADRPELPEGKAVLFLTIDVDGVVQHAQVVRSLEPELDALARSAALEAIFEPAYSADGAPLPVHSFAFPVAFDNPERVAWITQKIKLGRVGEVTGAVHSPRLEKNIAQGFLGAGASVDGLSVETPEGERQATVTQRPFIDPDKTIPRQPLR